MDGSELFFDTCDQGPAEVPQATLSKLKALADSQLPMQDRRQDHRR